MSDTSRPQAVGNGNEQIAPRDAAMSLGERAWHAGAEAADHARDIAQDAKARAGSLAGSIGDRAASAAEAQKSTLAESLESVAKAVHRSGEELEGQQDWVAQLVERGADELSALATTLRSNDLQSLLGDLGSLARRQPALFVGASMAAGFALARVGRLAVSPAPAKPAAPAASPMPEVRREYH